MHQSPKEDYQAGKRADPEFGNRISKDQKAAAKRFDDALQLGHNDLVESKVLQ